MYKLQCILSVYFFSVYYQRTTDVLRKRNGYFILAAILHVIIILIHFYRDPVIERFYCAPVHAWTDYASARMHSDVYMVVCVCIHPAWVVKNMVYTIVMLPYMTL